MPLAAAYMDDLEAAKPEASRLHLFHSAGGMASPAALRDLPLGLAASGPAAGVAAAGRMARALGIERAISFDMGGTTTDVCLILDGSAQIASDRSLGGRPLRQPMVAVESIGAGGGSIAQLDHGSLMVGPESAGAVPGPACYAKGGDRPTVTDANLLLGYMDTERVLGGDVRLDACAAHDVIAPLGTAMDMTGEAAALGVVRVANAAMLRALRRVTGGARRRRAQLHAARLRRGGPHARGCAGARLLHRHDVVVPAHSSIFSALGCVGRGHELRTAAHAAGGRRRVGSGEARGPACAGNCARASPRRSRRRATPMLALTGRGGRVDPLPGPEATPSRSRTPASRRPGAASATPFREGHQAL